MEKKTWNLKTATADDYVAFTTKVIELAALDHERSYFYRTGEELMSDLCIDWRELKPKQNRLASTIYRQVRDGLLATRRDKRSK